MRVLVLGAGVIGLTSAYYLVQQGHQVTVIDRQPGAALETSFANAGEISPGYASPWAAPGIPLKAVRWLMMEHAPLILRPKLDLAMASWIIAMLLNCTDRRYSVNKKSMVQLAEFSRDQLGVLRSKLGIEYEHRTQGTLQIFRTAKQLTANERDRKILDDFNIPYELLDRQGCERAEPGLAKSSSHIAGGLRLPDDETGDCHMFSHALEKWLKASGVDFHYNMTIESLEMRDGRIIGVKTDQGRLTGDAYLVALASYSPQLLRPAGISLPVYPVKGYSITLPVGDPSLAPVSTLLDDTYKIAITRLGNRIRVGGMAEISGFDDRLPARRQATLLHCLKELFPGSAAVGDTNFWSGLRPMTPDGPPVVGPTKIENLFLNTGHGTLGWTMACGSGHVVASLIDGTQPAIESAGLALGRYAR